MVTFFAVLLGKAQRVTDIPFGPHLDNAMDCCVVEATGVIDIAALVGSRAGWAGLLVGKGSVGVVRLLAVRGTGWHSTSPTGSAGETNHLPASRSDRAGRGQSKQGSTSGNAFTCLCHELPQYESLLKI